MKATLHIIKLIAIVLLFAGTASAQSLLTPTELSLAHQAADSSAVTASLAIKGYKPAYSWGNAGHKVSNWLFQTKQGEDYDFKIRKIIEPKHTITYYWITSDFYYQQFMVAALKENYKCAGVQLIEKQLYFVFKNGDTVFYTNQERDTDNTTYTVLMR